MIRYAAVKGNLIIEKEIIREDANSVFFYGSNGEEREESKQGVFYNYFDKWEDAKDFLWRKAITRASEARDDLKKYEKLLRKEKKVDLTRLNKLKAKKFNIEIQFQDLVKKGKKDLSERNLGRFNLAMERIKESLSNIEDKIIQEEANIYESSNYNEKKHSLSILIRKRTYFVNEVDLELKKIKYMTQTRKVK